MGRAAEIKKYYTVEEYLQFEEESEIRHEFYQNELFPIEAPTIRHNEIVHNLLFQFRPHFKAEGCKVMTENVKLEAEKNEYYPYPDLMLTCSPDDTHHLIVKYPILLAEVSSPGSIRDEHYFKWSYYRRLSSLRYYLIIAQNRVSVELFSRKTNTTIWTYQEFEDVEDIIHFDLLNFELPLSTIYEGISL
jgi:Uma2 family endonuclease